MSDENSEYSSNESSKHSSDDSWTPPKDRPMQKESLHASKQINKKGRVDENYHMRKTSSENKASTSSQRRKISCPLVACKAKVVHLPRHMRKVHHWTKE